MVPFAAWLEEPARIAGQALVNGIWQGVLLTAVVALVLERLRRINAATRHAVWCAALVAVVTLPVVAFLTEPAGDAARQVSSGVGAFQQHYAGTARTQTLGSNGWTIQVPSGPWLVLLLGFGLLVACARLSRVVMALRDLRRLKRESAPVPAPYRLQLESLLRSAPAGRIPDLRLSNEIRTPVTVGFVHPAILLPTQLLAELEKEELAQIALHELSHVRRRDDWTNLAQRLAEAVFWFHPAVRWIESRLDIERELACDDYAVAVIPGERSYARCLTHLAELAVASRSGTLAPGAAPRTSQLTRRVRALLEPNRSCSVGVSPGGGLASAAVLLAAVVALTRVAPVMAFVDTTLSSVLPMVHAGPTTPAVEPRTRTQGISQSVEIRSRTSTPKEPIRTSPRPARAGSAISPEGESPNVPERSPTLTEPVQSAAFALEPLQAPANVQPQPEPTVAAASPSAPPTMQGPRFEIAVQLPLGSAVDDPSPVVSASRSVRYGTLPGPGSMPAPVRILRRGQHNTLEGICSQPVDVSDSVPSPQAWCLLGACHRSDQVCSLV